MVPCASSPVTRVLCLPLREKTKRLRRRQEEGPFFLVAKKCLMNLSTSLLRLFPSNENGPLHLSFVLRLRLFFLMIAERPRAQRVQQSPIAIMGRDRKRKHIDARKFGMTSAYARTSVHTLGEGVNTL